MGFDYLITNPQRSVAAAEQLPPARAVRRVLAFTGSLFGHTSSVEHDERQLVGLQRQTLVDEQARVHDLRRKFGH